MSCRCACGILRTMTLVHTARLVGVEGEHLTITASAAANDALLLNRYAFPNYGGDSMRVREATVRVSAALVASDTAVLGKPPVAFDVKGLDYGFDLALAVADATFDDASAMLEIGCVASLGLGGELRPVRGCLARVKAIADTGACRTVVVCDEDLPEASLAENVTVYGARHLRPVLEFARTGRPGHGLTLGARTTLTPELDNERQWSTMPVPVLPEQVPRTGDVLLISPSYVSNEYRVSSVARAALYELGALGPLQALEVLAIRSAAGIGMAPAGAVRPARAPHCSVSERGLIGFELTPTIWSFGEVSMATHGVLVLDELGDWRTSSIEAMARVLEQGHVKYRRADGVEVRLPARPARIIASTLPCPCGRLGSPEGRCTCKAEHVDAFRARVTKHAQLLKLKTVSLP